MKYDLYVIKHKDFSKPFLAIKYSLYHKLTRQTDVYYCVTRGDGTTFHYSELRLEDIKYMTTIELDEELAFSCYNLGSHYYEPIINK